MLSVSPAYAQMSRETFHAAASSLKNRTNLAARHLDSFTCITFFLSCLFVIDLIATHCNHRSEIVARHPCRNAKRSDNLNPGGKLTSKQRKGRSRKQDDWVSVIDEVRPYLVRIMTPEGSGTGFFFTHNRSNSLVAIATAAHVVNRADWWKQPVRIVHETTGNVVFLPEEKRVILVDPKRDAASVIFSRDALGIPEETLPLSGEGKHIRVGSEIGWLGYPAIPRASLCFFVGRLSCWLAQDDTYLVDGVAINGVSGGPVFMRYQDGGTRFIGVVTAYYPNRSTGVSLPGLSEVLDVSHFHQTIKTFRNIDEAREKSPANPSPTDGRDQAN
jgi:hypothetical protein